MAENALYKTSLSKSMALCSRREYCVNDIRSKLELWGVATIDIEKIIALLKTENFINEERFATAFVRDKFTYNKWGKAKIAIHLRMKRIQGDIIKSALDCIDDETYIRVLKDLIANHRRTVKSKNQYDLKSKQLRFALSKGFESSLVYDVLKIDEE